MAGQDRYKPIHTNLKVTGKIKITSPVEELTDDDDVITVGYLSSLLNPPAVSGLTYGGHSQYIEVYTELKNLIFQWNESNGPENLILSDSKGIMGDVPVSDERYTGDDTYYSSQTTTVTWNLDGDGGVHSAVSTSWVYASYWGINLDGHIPNEDEILAGSKVITDTHGQFSVSPGNTMTEYVWFAVPVQANYTQWYISEDNKGAIGPGEFIDRYSSDIVVGPTQYERYITQYPSEIVGTIKLS
jgi:hypothetical protein